MQIPEEKSEIERGREQSRIMQRNKEKKIVCDFVTMQYKVASKIPSNRIVIATLASFIRIHHH